MNVFIGKLKPDIGDYDHVIMGTAVSVSLGLISIH